jgi:hypothetical protein
VPAKSQALRLAVAAAGGAARSSNQELITQTRRDLATERLASYIAKVVAEAPPLTPEQRTRLACLLDVTTDVAAAA